MPSPCHFLPVPPHPASAVAAPPPQGHCARWTLEGQAQGFGWKMLRAQICLAMEGCTPGVASSI